MWGYVEQRPRIEEGECERSQTRSWAAALMDSRMAAAIQKPMQYLMHRLASTTEETHNMKAIDNVTKLLTVAEGGLQLLFLGHQLVQLIKLLISNTL